MIENSITCTEGLVKTAWTIIDAANDFGDVAIIETCRRVIDAGLAGREASASDVKLMLDFFQ
jgi:hypothetical protein